MPPEKYRSARPITADFPVSRRSVKVIMKLHGKHAIRRTERLSKRRVLPYPVLHEWLSMTWWDLKGLPGRTVVQYGLYWRTSAPHGEFLALDPVDPTVVDIDLVIDAARERGFPESQIELLCIHLDNGDEFYIRVEEAYDLSGRLDLSWETWIEICRGPHTPEAG